MPWTAQRPWTAHTLSASRAPLWLETLEERAMLAVAAFDINLYRDTDGSPGALIADDTLQAGESFFAEIVAHELDPLVRGLARVSLNITWDPAVIRSLNTPFTPGDLITEHLPFLQTGVLNNDLGRIQNLGGSAFVGAGRDIGDGAPERFALLHFEALSTASDSPIQLAQGLSRIVTQPTATLRASQIDFEHQSITVLPAAGEEAGALSNPLPLTSDPTDPLCQAIQLATAPRPVALGTVVDVPAVPIEAMQHIAAVTPLAAAVPQAAAPAASFAPLDEPAAVPAAAVPAAVPAAVAANSATQTEPTQTPSAPAPPAPLNTTAFAIAAATAPGATTAPAAGAAADLVFQSTTTEELLSGTKQVYVDSALIQALACGLAAMKNPTDALDLFEDTSG